jgi:hypothetical protein
MRFPVASLFSAAVLASGAPQALGQTPAQPPTNLGMPFKAAGVEKGAQARVQASLDSIKSDQDFPRAARELAAVFDDLIASAPAADTDAFRETDFAVRLVSQLSAAPADKRLALYTYLRANNDLSRDLAFLIKPEDKLPQLFALLDRLREKHGADLNKFAALTAAVCVVHDQPLVTRVNENSATAPDPVLIWEYFHDHDKSMLFPGSKLPPELLISVVDISASVEDLNWALKKYAGDPKIGKHYFEIKYDMGNFKKGTAKKTTEAGFTLPNILLYGGVCADQSYFAQQVGKAVGVPTAGVFGRNATVAHAWVGYLEAHGDQIHWNFDTGHYAGYKGVRGTVFDPQTRQLEPDSMLSLLAESSTSNSANRQTAVAMTDAAQRLAKIQKDNTPFPPSSESHLGNFKRQVTVTDRLELLEAGLRKCPTYAAGWKVLSDAAAAGELAYSDKQRWAQILDSLCGSKYPDFSMDILVPMVKTVENIHDQDGMWNSLFGSFQKRPDLAAEVRFSQGEMWEKAGEKSKAWDCYQDVIKRFADDGPFTVDAAHRCEALLKDSGKDKDITPMYASIWTKVAKPADMAPEFRTQSNWFRIGAALADKLDADGNHAKAQEVRDKIGMPRK